MKIGMVLDDSLDKSDGVQQYVLTLGNWYLKNGHEVHYIVGQTNRKDIKNIHSMSKNIQVHFNQNRMSTPLPSNKKKIKDLLDDQQFDVLHIQMPYSPFMAGRVIKAASPKTAIIGTFHIIPFSAKEKYATKLLRIILWKNLRKFDSVISVSEPARKFAKKNFGVSSLVSPNVINLSLFHAGKKIKKYDDGKVNIVFLGRLVERKGCMELLKAIQEMHLQNLLGGVRVLICGKGPQESQLHDYVKHHRLSKCVQFTGFLTEKEKPNYLASADIAIFPSLGGESFGIVLLEAMASKSNVVLGGDNIGYRSVLKDRPIQLFDPKNTTLLIKTLKYFAFNSLNRKKAFVWQSKHILNYDVARVGPVIMGLYAQVIAKKRT